MLSFSFKKAAPDKKKRLLYDNYSDGYNSNLLVKVVTRCFASSSFASSSWFFNTRPMIDAISSISSKLKPRDVTAAVPIRTPLVTNGFSGSNGILFLFTVIPISSKACSATLPVKPKLNEHLLKLSDYLFHLKQE